MISTSANGRGDRPRHPLSLKIHAQRFPKEQALCHDESCNLGLQKQQPATTKASRTVALNQGFLKASQRSLDPALPTREATEALK
ncbi:hypothetical protein KIL84_005499 [Mauremys mutica]|uniref:Uncharacterized protein n=1 Tax=Mauremys mutica TaxID=74926 RepID=A0A9D3XKW4_9SAUR|nr:hypothetical protein KIL84_005499 [Mauremys mutica]